MAWNVYTGNTFIIDQASSVKMAGYRPRSLFASLDLDFTLALSSTGFASRAPGIA